MKEKELERKFADNEQKRVELEKLYEKGLEELQRISGLTQEQAKEWNPDLENQMAK